jgi:hypothetical protein
MSEQKPVSLLEQEYSLFDDCTIKAGDRLMLGTNSAGLLMRDMNRMYQVVAGLGVVMRIINGNAVLESEFDPSEPDEGAPPLSKVAEGMLTAMAAAMCEEMRDKMERRSNDFSREVKA